MQTTNSKPAATRRRRAILLTALLVLLIFSIGILVPNYRKIKHTLLRSLLSPTAYLSILEREYLTEQAEGFEQRLTAARTTLAARTVTGAEATLSVNQLLSGRLNEPLSNLKSAGLSLHHQTQAETMALTATISVNEEERLNAHLWSDTSEQKLYLQLPELSQAALSCSYSNDFLPARIVRETLTFLQTCILSAYDQIQANPYSYLIPYLETIEEVTMEEAYNIEALEQTATRLTAELSLQKALEIASTQLEEMKETNPLLPLWHLASKQLEELAATQDTTLLLTAYVDNEGNILGHEFALIRKDEILASVTGILTSDILQGKNGTLHLSYRDNTSGKLIDLPIELQQFGFSDTTGYPYGSMVFELPELSMLSCKVDFYESGTLPEAKLQIRALGFTAASVQFSLCTDTVSLPNPDTLVVAPPSEWDTFFSSFDMEDLYRLLLP
ncbi:MAG: hypothetical protein IJY09_00495 [Lachnospiraceae bacterium]|nr:hypothetical protein [Lachnospiraceae bacterium]